MPNSTPNSTLDELLCERIEAVVAKHTGGPFSRPRVIGALREVLDAGQLSRAEEQLLETNKRAGHADWDLLELSIAARVERALTAGLEAALGSADPDTLRDLPRVVVLSAETQRSGIDSPASDSQAGTQPTLILTDGKGLRQLRSSPSVTIGAREIELHVPDETDPDSRLASNPEDGVEVFEITGELQGLENRLSVHLSDSPGAPFVPPSDSHPTPAAAAPDSPATPSVPVSDSGTTPFAPIEAAVEPPAPGFDGKDGPQEVVRPAPVARPGPVAPPAPIVRVLAGAGALLLLGWVAHLALRPVSKAQAPVANVETSSPAELAPSNAPVRYFVADPVDPEGTPTIRVPLRDPGGERPNAVELVRRGATGDLVVEGLVAEWSADHVDFRVARPGGYQSWDSIYLKLTENEQVHYSEALSFAHVGRDAWRFGTLEIPIPGQDGLLLGRDEDVTLDPRGLALRIALEWTAANGAESIESLVDEPRVRAGGGEWLNTRFQERSSGAAWYAIDLDELGLVEAAASGTRTRLEVEASDASGNCHRAAFGLVAVTTPLELGAFAVSNRDQNEPPRNEQRAYVVSSLAPNLRLFGSFNREVTGTVFVRDESTQFTRSVPVRGRTLDSALDLSAGDDYSGVIRITALDLIPHAAPYRAEHQVEYDCAFEYTTKQATFAAALEVDGSTTELSSGATATITSANECLLWVRSKGGVPAQVQVTVAGAGTSVAPESAAIDSSSAGRFLLRLESDGLATVRIQSFRADPGRPEMDASYRILRDSRAPSLAFEADPILIREGDPEPELQLWVDRGDEARIGTAVELLDWKLRRLGSGVDLPLADSLPDSAQPSAAVTLRLPRVHEDGTYELSVRARDAAENEAETPAVLRWDVARNGPDVRPLYPESLEWRPRDGRYEVVYAIEDPNGIRASARCRVRALGGALPERVIQLTQGPAAEWRGECRFTHEWSGQLVELIIEVEDVHGNPGQATAFQRQLPTIALEYPAAVALNVRDAHAITSMRIIETAGRGAYEFKGRADSLENELFKQAGLKVYAGRGDQRSWKILYREGEIPPFYLDEYEVSNAQYLKFMRATGAGGPKYLNDGNLTPERAEQPVVGVTWDEANAYADWVGKRLPSYVEWEYALRGGTQYRPYSSWVEGRAPPSSNVINVASPSHSLWPAGRGRDVTPEGIWNLSGNVSEWTSTPFYFDESIRTTPSNLKQHAIENRHRYLRPDSDAGSEFWIAGGCYELPGYHFACNDQRQRDVRLDYVGFRCAADADQVMMGLEGSSPRFVSLPAEEER